MTTHEQRFLDLHERTIELAEEWGQLFEEKPEECVGYISSIMLAFSGALLSGSLAEEHLKLLAEALLPVAKKLHRELQEVQPEPTN